MKISELKSIIRAVIEEGNNSAAFASRDAWLTSSGPDYGDPEEFDCEYDEFDEGNMDIEDYLPVVEGEVFIDNVDWTGGGESGFVYFGVKFINGQFEEASHRETAAEVKKSSDRYNESQTRQGSRSRMPESVWPDSLDISDYVSSYISTLNEKYQEHLNPTVEEDLALGEHERDIRFIVDGLETIKSVISEYGLEMPSYQLQKYKDIVSELKIDLDLD